MLNRALVQLHSASFIPVTAAFVLGIVYAWLVVDNRAHAATLEYVGATQPADEFPCASKYENYRLRGPIAPGDLARVKALQQQQTVKNANNFREHCTVIRLNLDSEGGNFSEALDIAAYVWFEGIATYVGPSAKCLSACALIFMGGAAHAGDGYRASNRSLHHTARLGFHAPFLNPRIFKDTPTEALRDMPAQTFQGALEVAAKLLRFSTNTSLPPSLIEEMLEVPPERFVEVDNIDKLARWMIRPDGFRRDLVFEARDLAALCANQHDWFHQQFLPSTEKELLARKSRVLGDGFDRTVGALMRSLVVGSVSKDTNTYTFTTGDDGINCEFSLSYGGSVADNKWSRAFNDLHAKPDRLWHALPPQTLLVDAARILEARASSGGVVQTPEAPEGQTSYWVHNKSEVRMMLTGGDGTYGLKIEYSQPRPGMIEQGVVPGDLLVTGYVRNDQVVATAFVFKKGCPPQSYPVKGMLDLTQSSFRLEGAASRYMPNSCSGSAPDPRSKSSSLLFEKLPSR